MWMVIFAYHRGQAPVIGLISKADAKKRIGLFLPIAAYRPPQPYIYLILSSWGSLILLDYHRPSE